MNDWLTQQAETLIGQREYELERLILSVHRQIVERMEQLQVSRAQLAKSMGIGRWSISRLLNNVSNIELKTLVNAASALECRVTLNFDPLQSLGKAFGERPVASYATRVEVPVQHQTSLQDKHIEVSAGVSGNQQTAPEPDGEPYATAA